MRLVKLTTAKSREELMKMLMSQELVNARVRFDERYGKPVMKIKEKGDRIRVTCEMVGGPSKDNGFLIGTSFWGRVKETGDGVTLRGVITTSPIYHAVLLILTVFYVLRCIQLGGFNPVPLVLLVFSYFLFRREYKKQGMIQRYLARAVRMLGEK